jgi:hypothetical protein
MLVASTHVRFVSVENLLETTWKVEAKTLKSILSGVSPIKLGRVALIEMLVAQM